MKESLPFKQHCEKYKKKLVSDCNYHRSSTAPASLHIQRIVIHSWISCTKMHGNDIPITQIVASGQSALSIRQCVITLPLQRVRGKIFIIFIICALVISYHYL